MTIKRFGDKRDWFFEKRFGLFIHWGLYAINGFHEQEMYRKRIPREEYGQLINEFNPTGFDPEEWLDMAEETGMEYITFTTKHIDGFCMWDTAYSDFKITNTPYRKDILRQLVDSCQRRNFPICFYYSLVDSHHANYPSQNRPHELIEPEPGDKPEEDLYLGYVKNQIRELCTNYGPIHGIWWDGNNFSREDSELNDMIHQLQPQAVINSRGLSKGDFAVLERDYLANIKDGQLAFDEPTEGCQSIGCESWGYRLNEDYYSNLYLKSHILEYMAKDANYLLNIGPKSDGTFPGRAVEILKDIGQWFNGIKESLRKAEPCSEIIENRDVLLTKDKNILYVHCFKRPVIHAVSLKPIDQMPIRAILLNNDKQIECALDYFPKSFPDQNKYLRLINLPLDDFNEPWVIKLEFEKEIDLNTAAVSEEIG
ncbi:MAG: alpha-L-fucosidase [Planctomycetota bacterium]|jgi:alpha-L-fucosidase